MTNPAVRWDTSRATDPPARTAAGANPPPGYRWCYPQSDEKRARQLSHALGLPLPVARVLLNRGYARPEEAERFLAARFADLHSPLLLPGMEAACRRMEQEIESGREVLLYGDYDVDGIAAVLVLQKAIQLAGGGCRWHIPHRIRDGYGMRQEVIEEAAAQGIRLIVSVDTGIRAAEVVQHAAGLGIDCIITDHHLPEGDLPPAVAVINPHLSSSCYPEPNLCGAAVSFKLAQALLERLGWSGARLERMLASLAKLVAIATVADVVPLTGENRILVKHGLEGLREVRNPGLRALLDVAGFRHGQTPSPAGIAFRVAPRINAAGRMADALEVMNLFLAEDAATARMIAARLDDLNEKRRMAEAAIVEEILARCEREPVAEEAALVFAGENWHRGVLGIVATRLVERFHRPAIVLSVDTAKGEAQGSGRSTDGFHLLSALEELRPLLVRFGGHSHAAGLTLRAESVDEFRRRFQQVALRELKDNNFQPELELDAKLRLAELDARAVEEIFRLAPFGFGNPPPLFYAEDVRIATEPAVKKEKHLRLVLEQDAVRLPAMAWNFSARREEFRAGALLDVVLRVDEDPWAAAQGQPGWGLTLLDAKSSSV